jgi:hypothetical protein
LCRKKSVFAGPFEKAGYVVGTNLKNPEFRSQNTKTFAPGSIDNNKKPEFSDILLF